MQIGVRELRQNASRYLARAQAGEVFEVTSRGRVVAKLVPAEGDVWEQLVVAGQLDPGAADLLQIEPAREDFSPSERLAALRAGER